MRFRTGAHCPLVVAGNALASTRALSRRKDVYAPSLLNDSLTVSIVTIASGECRRLSAASAACSLPFNTTPSCFAAPALGVAWTATTDACADALAAAYQLPAAPLREAAAAVQTQQADCAAIGAAVRARLAALRRLARGTCYASTDAHCTSAV